jgi:hypothetical protein
MTVEKQTPDQWREAWLAAKASNPLLERSEFARDNAIAERTLRRYLEGVHGDEREILSRYIADRIAACSKDRGIEPCDLTWHPFRTWAKIAYGHNSKGITAHHITSAGGFNRIRDSYFPPNPTKQQVERKVVETHALYNRRLGETLSKRQWLAESLESYAERVFKGRIDAPKWTPPKPKECKRLVNTVWSDLHFGSNLQAVETGAFDFGKVEEARRMAHVVGEIADYKPQYRDSSELVIWLIGDIMHGHLHPGDMAAHAEQMARSIHLLSQAVAYLSGCYSRVSVKCASGNHGRNKQRHSERATDAKWDSHETVIYYAVKAACSKLQNVSVEIPLTPHVIGEAFGVGTFATHGDTVFEPGYPGREVKTGSILAQINQMNMDWADNARERGIDHVPCAVFVCGHVHSPVVHPTVGGRAVVTNGSLVPADGFSTSNGRFSSPTGQWVWEQVEGFPLGDARFVRVGFKQDQDAKLDRIIRPWAGF